jgi:hypothetical protein
MREPEFDPGFVDWLRDGPSAPSDWVLPAVEHHARRHPRRRALVARWIDAMKAVALRHPLTPAARAVVAVAAVAIAVGLGGLLLTRWPALISAPGTTPTPVSPTSSPSASATPGPVATPAPALDDRAEMFSDYLEAWHRGDQPWAEQHLASDLRTVLIGSATLTDGGTLANGAEHFEIVPGGRGYVYWESRGDPIHGGTVSAMPTVAGGWDPGYLVWAVLRLDDQGRIATQWLIIRPNPFGGHEVGGTHATSAPASVVTFLDGCREAFANRYSPDAGGYTATLDCYAPGAGVWITASDPSGAWTEAYTEETANGGRDGPIDEWTQANGSYSVIERTGDVVMLGDIATYPFRQRGSSTCAAGVDLLEMTPEHSRILSHWVFCGPDPLPPSSTPTEVTGTWGVLPEDPLSITLGSCDQTGVCGELRWHCHGEDCTGQLTYRGTTDDALAFEVTDTSTFGCAYDQLGGTVLVRPTADGLEVSTPGFEPGRNGVILPRTDASPRPSESPGG